jgi:hypothetical protein
MNGKKARALRKMVGFHPTQVRKYYVVGLAGKNSVDRKGLPINSGKWIMVDVPSKGETAGRRRLYQDLKAEIRGRG